ncbi:S9 family peptidase [Paracoccus aestuarii]|uniref:S9 family peptidase n=1 Tax=Paracoccus aestuarii TaxID=453842 RepID=UPI001474D99D|nr:prolyl oligopeptidase family serine peptidase [Paracoccus aestuarii]WCQ98584.1 S9 family peptidase [Paracoccus aestuarii]
MAQIDPSSILPLVEIPSARAPACSPTGDAVAFIDDRSGMPQLWIIEDGEARQLTDHPEPVNSFAWSPIGTQILFTADCGGDERWQLYLLQPETGAIRALTADPMTVHMWGAFSPDGQQIAFTANDRQKDQLDLRVMELATGAVQAVAEAAGHQEVLSFAPDGASLLVRRTLGAASDQKLELVEIATGRRSPVLDADRRVKFAAARMLKAGGGLALCDFEGDRMALWGFDQHGASTGCVFRAEGCDLDAFAREPDQDSAVVTINEDGFCRLARVNLTTGESRPLAVPLDGVVTGLTVPAGGNVALCAVAGAANPSAIWELPLSGDTAVKRHGAEPLPGEVEAELSAFNSFDGLRVPFFLYRPKGEAPPSGWPAVFIIHGGPEMQWRPEWRADVQWLVRQGIMVVAPNVRGSTGYGRRYHGLDDREKRLNSLVDLTALRAYLVADGTVDGARTCVFGRSYGGYMVMAALAETPDLWRCGVNFYGIGNFATHLLATGPWARQIRVAEYGDPATDAEMLARISPVNRIDRVRAPLLMVHADRDPRVPPCESEIINSLMFGLGRRCDFLRISHEGHGFKRIDNIRRVFGTLAEFIAQEL